MAREMEVSIGGRRVVVELLDKEAPTTCNKLWEVLPVKSVTTNAKFVGDELIIMVPMMADNENQRLDVGIGDVGYFPMQQTLCFFFGKLRPFGFCNIVGKVTEGIEKLKEASIKILEEGVEPAELRRIQ